MKASPGDFLAFERYMQQLAQFGNGQSMETAAQAEEIAAVFMEAKIGVIGRKCACGRSGVTTRQIQAARQWPFETHVLCADHAALVDDFNGFMEQIVAESQPKI